MSFGFGATDFLAVIKLIQTVVSAVKRGPSEFQEIYRELKSLNIALKTVQENVNNRDSLLNRKGASRTRDLNEIIHNCYYVVSDVQALVSKHSSLEKDSQGVARRAWNAYEIGSADLDTLRGRLTFYTSTIDMFLHSLEGPALGRIEAKLDLLFSHLTNKDGPQTRQSVVSVASTATILSIFEPDQEDDAWKFLRAELMAEGILPTHLAMYKTDIISYVKEKVIEPGLSQSQRTAGQRTSGEGVQTSLLAPVSACVPRYGFAGGTYLYIIECQMEDGRQWELTRYYADFYDMQILLLSSFPEEAGSKGKPRILPFCPGPVAHVTDAISNGRRSMLDDYIRNLLSLPPHISGSLLIRKFFAPRHGDTKIDP